MRQLPCNQILWQINQIRFGQMLLLKGLLSFMTNFLRTMSVTEEIVKFNLKKVSDHLLSSLMIKNTKKISPTLILAKIENYIYSYIS